MTKNCHAMASAHGTEAKNDHAMASPDGALLPRRAPSGHAQTAQVATRSTRSGSSGGAGLAVAVTRKTSRRLMVHARRSVAAIAGPTGATQVADRPGPVDTLAGDRPGVGVGRRAGHSRWSPPGHGQARLAYGEVQRSSAGFAEVGAHLPTTAIPELFPYAFTPAKRCGKAYSSIVLIQAVVTLAAPTTVTSAAPGAIT
jgi:hypothetical protein